MEEYGGNPDPREENFDRFLAEGIYWERENAKKTSKYKDFYNEGKNLWLDLGLDIERKEELLVKYFPKFSDSGSEPISKMEPLQKSRLFKRIILYAREK